MNCLLIIGLIGILLNIVQLEPNVSTKDPVLTLENGSIQGRVKMFRGVEVYQFFCIPYAEPPIGENRFKRPIPKSGWNNVLSTRDWGPHCIQAKVMPKGIKMSEDCLCLNVFTPSIAVMDVQKGDNQQLRPVMVWIHGGSLHSGSANSPAIYDGTALAALENVIIVTINYRLGVFGFLHLPEADVPGNMGLWDQNLALNWVKSNIIHFGGDPDRVTIFGESAGSLCISAHIVSPQSEGLFKNAIMQSGASYKLKLQSTQEANESFLKLANCPSDADLKSCVSSFNYSDHPEVDLIDFWIINGDDFLPVEPEEIITSSGVGANLNLLVGTVGNEGAFMLVLKDPITFNPADPMELDLDKIKGILDYLFGPPAVDYFLKKYNLTSMSDNSDELRLQLSKIVGDVLLTCPTYLFAHDLVKANNLEQNVYGYYQSQRSSRVPFELGINKWLPVTHTDDLLPIFGYPFKESENYSSEDLILSSMMTNIWTTFAKTGKPPSIGPSKWSKWKIDSDRVVTPFVMELNSEKIGQSNQNVANWCLNDWSFSMEKSYFLKSEPGKLSKLSS